MMKKNQEVGDDVCELNILLLSQQPAKFISYKPCESRDIDFSNGHVTKELLWSFDQRVMFGSFLHCQTLV